MRCEHCEADPCVCEFLIPTDDEATDFEVDIEQLLAEREADEAAKRRRRRTLMGTELHDLYIPVSQWLVRDLVPMGTLGAFIGERASGKSALAYSLAYSVATGRPFLGRYPTQRSGVVIFALEGYHGVCKRLIALRDHYRTPRHLCAPLYASNNSFSFESSTRAAPFASALNEYYERHDTWPGLIIIDTVAYAIGSSEENSDGMRNFVLEITRHQSVMNNTILCIHHPSKGNARQARGHSSFEGAMDFIYLIEKLKTSKKRTIVCTKMKDHNDDIKDNFHIAEYTIKKEADGERITAAFVMSGNENPPSSDTVPEPPTPTTLPEPDSQYTGKTREIQIWLIEQLSIDSQKIDILKLKAAQMGYSWNTVRTVAKSALVLKTAGVWSLKNPKTPTA